MPKLIHMYCKAITAVNKALFIAAAALMAIIVPVMMYEVISRYVFHAPTVWGMELAVLLFGPYFLLGGPYLLHLGGHVSLDLFRRRMGPRSGRIIDTFNQLVILIFCSILLYYSTPLALQAMAYRETSFSAWNPPLWPYKFAVPVAVLLLGLQSIAEILRLWMDKSQETAA
ncbi:TRAP transporter small permease subunit [Allopusillimonas ginsengisoli]|uniref:TRAP transporter small permease subunit n=1 Tax=Allopusillimonas ginsengisoli TaxID=453575 RepID=UPI0010C17F48|nr:TRAP transporter small permease [Allopusillimonas ginsengisoli]